MINRPRRLRVSNVIRELVKETTLTSNDLIHPIFIKYGNNIKNPIASLPEHYQLSVDNLDAELEEITNLGIKAVILFGIPATKDEIGSHSFETKGIIAEAIRQIKQNFSELIVIADICLCEYTTHGHCGKLTSNNQEVDNDATIQLLAKQAVNYAIAGVDIVAPSAMMDGMVQAIRSQLDEAGCINTAIMSYSVKYASSMYGPFRMAAEGAPQFGDRSTYQMDYANSNEAIKEAKLDIEQGADFLMVKPAHTYLDIIYKIKNNFPEIPLAAYHTSGEYAMIKAASRLGVVDEEKAMHEVLTSIKRAGADLIITYFAKQLARMLAK